MEILGLTIDPGSTGFWSWLWLSLFLIMILGIGFLGMVKTKTGDDFAVARSSYGPVVLVFAIAATTASGATFLGLPGLAYKFGFPAMWYAVLYPIAIYGGFVVSMYFIKYLGDKFGSNSIPEFLGQRYDSNALRILFALLSLLLIYYATAQMVASAVLFEQLLAIDYHYGLLITALVVGFYITIGGSHSDIMTDFVQGIIMVAIAILIAVVFFFGVGIEGSGVSGASAINSLLGEQDLNLTWDNYFSADSPLFASFGLVLLLFVAHIPFALNPHIGNKVFALKDKKQFKTLILLLVPIGSLMAVTVLGGLHARALLGEGLKSDAAIPTLFTEIFPPFLAAFLGIAILSAILSTADGLFVSVAVIFSNDLYKRTLAPIIHKKVPKSEKEIDSIALWISRLSTILGAALATLLAWDPPEFLAVLLWIGVGGIMSGVAGPLLVGTLWKRATRIGALASFFTGVSLYILLYAIIPKIGWESGGVMAETVKWITPFSVAGVGVIAGALTMVVVSLLTPPMDREKLEEIFGAAKR